MSDKENEAVNISDPDILKEPYTGQEDIVDMLIEGNYPGKRVGETVKDAADKNLHEDPDPEPILSDPIINLEPNELEEEEEKDNSNGSLMPIVNDPSAQVQANTKSEQLQQLISDPVENDQLVSVIRQEKPSVSILNQIMEEIAEEIAYLKAWRAQNWNAKEDLSDATFKRIKMLKNLVETVVEKDKLRQQQNVGKIDFYGENFQNVLKNFLNVIQTTFQKVNIPPQYEDIFFTQLAKEFNGFERKAEKIYYGKDS